MTRLGAGGMFSAPTWLRDLGFASWLLVGFALVLVALIWLLAQTATIVMPMILAAVLGAVAGPIVEVLQRRGVPRAAGAGLVLLGLLAIGAVIVFLVVHGIAANDSKISATASTALDEAEGWLKDAGANGTTEIKADIKRNVPEIGDALLHGVSAGISGLTSIVFFLSFATLGTFFVLKDAPVYTRFINRHMGVPADVASIVTHEVGSGLRNYFAGVTIVAAFNGLVVGLGALVLGVPLAGTIAVVTFATAYIPYIGAWTAGIFAVALALGSQGATDALILVVIVFLANGLLQNMLQPFVFGATLSLNPLVVLVVTIGAGALFGLVGLTLAAPLTSAAVHISAALRGDADRAPAEDSSPAPAGSTAPITPVGMTGELSSWRDGPAKRAIAAFVARVTGADGSEPVPVEERVAVFDNDGTLWCEQPMPIQLDFILRRLVAMAEADAALRERQPWKAAYERDYGWLSAVMAQHYAGDETNVKVLAAGILAAYRGISVEDFEARAGDFLHSAQHPTLGRGYLECAYAPMVELLAYLAANGFANYIASGGGRDFMRPISQEVYGIPRERVIGSSSTFSYTSDEQGGTITHNAEADYLDDGPQKPIRIWSRTGRRPLLAAGNSNGDVPMLHFSQHADKPFLRLLVLHDDGDREFAYTTGAEQALDQAARDGWTVVSVKHDWAEVF